MVGVDMMMLWWQYDDHFLKTSNFEEALGPGEDVVKMYDMMIVFDDVMMISWCCKHDYLIVNISNIGQNYNFLKTSNFEQALSPGEDVVEVADVLPLQHLGRVHLRLENLTGEGVKVVLLGIE